MKNSGFKSLLSLVILLLVLVQIIPTQTLAQQNKRWVGFIQYSSATDRDTLNDPCVWVKNGIFKMPYNLSRGGMYFTNFSMNDTFCVNNNFTWELKLKNPYDEEGAQSSYDVYLTLLGLCNSYALFNLFGDQNAGFAGCGWVNDAHITGSPEYIIDLQNWDIITFKFQNNICHYIVNGKDLIDIKYPKTIDYLTSYNLAFKGSGSLDWVKIYDSTNNVIYFEDFLDCKNPVLAPACFVPNIDIPEDFKVLYSQPLCEGDTLYLSTLPVQPEFQIHWSGPNNFTSDLQNPIIIGVKSNMSGKYNCTISNQANCIDKTVNFFVKINPKPDASIIPTNIILCDGDSAILKVNNPKNNYSYKWSSGETSSQIIIKKPGSYSVDVTDTSGCESISNKCDVIIKPKPDASINSSTNLKLCDGDSVILKVNKPKTNYSYKWSTGDTTSMIIVRKTGSYSVTVTDTSGCDSISNKCDVIFNPKPDASISSSANFISCNGDSAILKINNPKNSYSYKWSTGETSQQIIARKPGSYFVTVTDTSGCESISNIIDISYQGGGGIINIESILPQGVFQFDTVVYPVISCKRLILKNYGFDVIKIQNVQLFRNIEFSIPQSQFPLIIQPGDTAGLEICYTPSQKGIQSDTLIILDTCFNINLPLSATGMPEEILGMSKCNVNVNLITQFKHSVEFSYPIPNPATDIIEIQFNGNTNLQNDEFKELNILFDIYDLYGNLIQANLKADLNGLINTSTQFAGAYSINISHIESGYYFLRIKNSGETNIFPIIIYR